MLKMTRHADYGIMLLTHVAGQPEGSVHTARDLSKDTHVPLPMVSKVLKTLARSGLLTSHRGVKGGYQLARRPQDVTLAEVIGVLDGPIGVTDCISGDCLQSRWCPVERNWRKINTVITHALSGITLADMSGTLPDRLVTVELEMPARTAHAGR